ncbi:MAG: SH3 domain-containing protein [Bdellovibrionota bacterium]
MTEDRRVDLGLADFLKLDKAKISLESESEIKSQSAMRKVDANSNLEVSTELLSLFASNDWKKLSQISEAKITENELLSPIYRSLWVKSQIELKTTPASMLVAPLDSARKQLNKLNGIEPEVKKKARSLIKLCYAKLAETFVATQDTELYTHCINLAELPVKELSTKIPVCTNSLATKKTQQIKQKSKFLPLVIILLIAGIAGISAYFLADKIYLATPVATELAKLETPEAKLPDPKRASVLEHLDPLLHNTPSKPAPERIALKKTELVKARDPKVPIKQVDTTGPIEPEDVFNKIKNGEPLPVLSTESASIVPLKPDSKSLRFKLIARTKIMSSPSYTADSVGQLNIGQEVDVVEEGRVWLKLKAKSGRYGYVLAQDAVPVDK